jgi:hypothetical protein
LDRTMICMISRRGIAVTGGASLFGRSDRLNRSDAHD